MTATFTATRLVGHRMVVKGTDIFGTTGETVLDSSQWDEIHAINNFEDAEAEFAEAVEKFFAPLDEAADKVAALKEQAEEDEFSTVVLSEGVEHVVAQPARVVNLTNDSIVLRLLSLDLGDRLIWVNGSLEILA